MVYEYEGWCCADKVVLLLQLTARLPMSEDASNIRTNVQELVRKLMSSVGGASEGCYLSGHE